MNNFVNDKILTALQDKLRGYEHITRAALFGSRARGDFGERSDYDIAVYGTLPLAERFALKHFCEEELPTLHKIDLIFMSDIHEERFINRIHEEEIVFYEKTGK